MEELPAMIALASSEVLSLDWGLLGPHHPRFIYSNPIAQMAEQLPEAAAAL